METKCNSKFIITDDTTTIIELRPEEIQLIKALRYQWRFGDIVIKVKDGVPFRLVRITEFIDLNEGA